VAEARAAGPSLSAAVKLPPDAPPELRKHAGQSGRLRLVKLSFDGFEQVEILVPVVVLGDGEVLEPALGESLLRGTFRDPERKIAPTVAGEVLEDATEEVLFSVQSAVDAAEQKRFERALQQADRFIEDRLLVLKRRRRTTGERLEQALLRRDGATGSEMRTAAERAVLAAQTALEEVEGAIRRLEERDDETFCRYQDHIQQRRYAPTRVEQLFDLELIIE